MVYSDRGGLQCPEPLLPVGPLTPPNTAGSSGVAGSWASGRPYVNAHFVLRPWERVVDVKFQPLTTVAELATWGYRVRYREHRAWGVSLYIAVSLGASGRHEGCLRNKR